MKLKLHKDWQFLVLEMMTSHENQQLPRVRSEKMLEISA